MALSRAIRLRRAALRWALTQARLTAAVLGAALGDTQAEARLAKLDLRLSAAPPRTLADEFGEDTAREVAELKARNAAWREQQQRRQP